VLIDCQTCIAPEEACGDCVVAVLLRRPPEVCADLDDQECAALDSLAGAGLVPPLRLVPLLAGQRSSPSRRRARRPA
jgi:hypothetical protein